VALPGEQRAERVDERGLAHARHARDAHPLGVPGERSQLDEQLLSHRHVVRPGGLHERDGPRDPDPRPCLDAPYVVLQRAHATSLPSLVRSRLIPSPTPPLPRREKSRASTPPPPESEKGGAPSRPSPRWEKGDRHPPFPRTGEEADRRRRFPPP